MHFAHLKCLVATIVPQAGFKCTSLKVHKIPAVVLKSVTEAPPKDLDDGEKIFMSIPEDLRAALLPYQIEGVLFGLQQGGRAIIGDEMVNYISVIHYSFLVPT